MKQLKCTAVILIVTAMVSGLSGCANGLTTDENVDADIVDLSYKAADILMVQAGNRIDTDKAIITASFANIDNLDESSSFGRIVSQQLSSRFIQKGYKVAEMLLRKNIYIREKEGEFLLSRAVKNISAQHDAQAVVVGTYAIASENVYVTAKMVRTSDNVVLSSLDYSLPIGPDLRRLVRKR
jgi:TolB-like protein